MYILCVQLVSNCSFCIIALDDMTGSSPSDITQSPEENGAIPLPDIKQALKKKAMEEELARIEEEKDEQRVRIKRTDKEAFAKVCNGSCYCDVITTED